MGPLRGACPRPRRRSLNPPASSDDFRAWPVLERRATPAELHASPPDPLGRRLACVCFPLRPSVVIGSAQPASDFDAERLSGAGLDLVRRRSGGGAVLVAPGRQVWLDVFVPNGDVLAQADVGRSFHWLGQSFAEAIASVLKVSLDRGCIEVHRGAADDTLVQDPLLCRPRSGRGDRCRSQGGRDVAAQGTFRILDPLDGASQ